MPVQIIHKKSETAGAVPQLSALQFGELAVNSADGDVFFKSLLDASAGLDPANQFILSVRRPRIADGGEITEDGAPPPPPPPPPPAINGTPLLLAEMLDSIYNYDWYN